MQQSATDPTIHSQRSQWLCAAVLQQPCVAKKRCLNLQTESIWARPPRQDNLGAHPLSISSARAQIMPPKRQK